MCKLAVVSTHPIQYHTPWFQVLERHPAVDLEVFFCHHATPAEQAAAGFGVQFDWDVPLLEGYRYQFLKNVARQPSISRFSGLDVPEIADIVRSRQFDAVLVSGWTYKGAWQTFFACWRAGIPLMVRGDSHLHTPRSLFKRAAKYPFYRWFLSRMDAGLAVGQWSREYFLHYGIPQDRVFTVPHVIDEERFLQVAGQLAHRRNELRGVWNLPADAVVYLFCGKLNEQKRPLDFIKSLSIAHEYNPTIVGLIVGDGPLREACESLTDELNAPIRFAGFQNQAAIPQLYAIADMIVLPSNETWGLVINEAMFSGRPALVCDQVGSWPDLIDPGETGDTFRMGDIEQLAVLMMRYAGESDLLRRMGNNAREKIRREFNIAQAVDGMLQALRRVVK